MLLKNDAYGLWAEIDQGSDFSELVSKPDFNTILHIAASVGQLYFINLIIQRSPHLLNLPNSKGDLPVHVAARACQLEAVERLVFWAEEIGQLSTMLETVNEDKDTALHIALQNHQENLAKCLFRKCPKTFYYLNKQGFSPLYLAIKAKCWVLAKDMLSEDIVAEYSDAEDHLLAGVSVVHAKQTRFLLNNKGQNILHVAAANGKVEVVKYILQQQELETLINMKDEDGNTPFHLASKEKHPKVVYALTWDYRVKIDLQNKLGYTALDIAEEYYVDIPSFEERLTWLSLRYAGVPRAPQLHYFNIEDTLVDNNNTSPTAFIVLDQQTNPLKTHIKMKRKNKYKERINTLLVVSILVTTVTYASGFTVPGGYKNNAPNEGMATLAHKCAFQVFVISNTIAMYTSILAAVTLIWAHLDDLRLVMMSLDFALPLLGTALALMSVAFTAGLYVVLYNVVSWLSIVVLVMGGLFLGALMVLFIPLYSPPFCIRNKILRYVFHVPFTIMLLACEKGKSGTHC